MKYGQRAPKIREVANTKVQKDSVDGKSQIPRRIKNHDAKEGDKKTPEANQQKPPNMPQEHQSQKSTLKRS